ncbi:VanW family protein [Clostridium baratii]|uniref:VanW family protein n=1 Tax=Clostridium baratii TaxID=1561 RepID=UPI001C036FE6|nr:VanW family protein [Clostridium baratii]MBT9831486.1 vancomycin resistance protein [Clostridium baratii]
MQKKLLSQRGPVFYFLAVWYRRILRYKQWYFSSIKFTKERDFNKLPYRVKKHQSVLIRKLGDSDMQLQLNKVENLKIAIKNINGIIIKPGEVFSFCKLVGLPTKRKGYLEGMELCFGEARPGVGGGLCQIANLLNWLVIHSPLTVTERHHHGFDPFPDNGRVLPFGSGATIFYNYGDFQVKNNTNHTFQINLWMSEKCLEGELRVSEELDFGYHVFEKNHKFTKVEDKYYRQNEIWRNKIAKFEGGRILDTELVTKNCALVKYVPEEFKKKECVKL